MRNFIAAIALSAALTGCAGQLPPIGGAGGQQFDFIAMTKQICNWEPVAATAVSLIASIGGFSATSDALFALAQRACALINRPGVSRGVRRVPVLNGVSLVGSFVRR